MREEKRKETFKLGISGGIYRWEEDEECSWQDNYLEKKDRFAEILDQVTI